MKSFLRYALVAIALCLLPVSAQAVNCNVTSGTCFWIGGSGTMDLATDSAHWSNTTGGTTCSCEPAATPTLTFDGSSGAGTVTFGATINVFTINATTYTGTLDDSGNYAVTVSNSINIGGAGSPSLIMGSNVWSAGNFTLGATTTFTKGTSSLVLTGTLTNPDGTTFNGITIAPPAGTTFTFASTATFSSITVTPPAIVIFQVAKVITDTDAGGLNLAGTSSAGILIRGSSSTSSNLAVSNPSVATFAAFYNMNIETSSMTATNSVNAGHNTTSLGGSLSISGGSGGAGSHCIGC
jgi:hypothetical protein